MVGQLLLMQTCSNFPGAAMYQEWVPKSAILWSQELLPLSYILTCSNILRLQCGCAL